MLETRCIGNNFKMWVTVSAILVTNILYLLTLASGANIQKMSPSFYKIVPPCVWMICDNCHICGSRKIQRLIRVSLSTEFFSKRRKNYTFWRETRAEELEMSKIIKYLDSSNLYGACRETRFCEDGCLGASNDFPRLIIDPESPKEVFLACFCLFSTRHNDF